MNYYELDYRLSKEAAEILRAITHPLRLAIISLLDNEGTINVNKIYSSLQLEQSITSQHLKILRDTAVVLTQRKGKQIYYSLNYPRLQAAASSTEYFDMITRERNKRKKKQYLQNNEQVAA